MKIRESNIELVIHSIAHFLVDCLCCTIVYRQTENSLELTYLYNTMAFLTQIFTGMLADQIHSGRINTIIGSLMVAIMALSNINGIIGIFLCGLGNSLFHTGAGYSTLVQTKNRMTNLGILVAPGCVGLVIGRLYPKTKNVFGILLILLAISIFFIKEEKTKTERQAMENRKVYLLLLLVCIMLRSVGSSVVSFPWNKSTLSSLVLVLAVFMGKAFGGILMDAKKDVRWIAGGSILATFMISFLSDWMFPSLFGQFLLNLSMPLTLWEIYLLYPSEPGFAFGIAAASLWPGFLIGESLQLNGVFSVMFLNFSFILQAFIIIYADKKIGER